MQLKLITIIKFFFYFINLNFDSKYLSFIFENL